MAAAETLVVKIRVVKMVATMSMMVAAMLVL